MASTDELLKNSKLQSLKPDTELRLPRPNPDNAGAGFRVMDPRNFIILFITLVLLPCCGSGEFTTNPDGSVVEVFEEEPASGGDTALGDGDQATGGLVTLGTGGVLGQGNGGEEASGGAIEASGGQEATGGALGTGGYESTGGIASGGADATGGAPDQGSGGIGAGGAPEPEDWCKVGMKTCSYHAAVDQLDVFFGSNDCEVQDGIFELYPNYWADVDEGDLVCLYEGTGVLSTESPVVVFRAGLHHVTDQTYDYPGSWVDWDGVCRPEADLPAAPRRGIQAWLTIGSYEPDPEAYAPQLCLDE